MPHDIFVCYSRSDREFADKVVQRLGSRGWSVFQDVNTHVGRRWHKEIERELHAARAVVVLWSAASRDSDFVLEEAEFGKRKDILFPAFIERVEFPYGFGRIQTADLVGWGGEEGHPGFAQLLQALSLQLGGGETAQVRSLAGAGPADYPAAGTTFRDKLVDGGDGPLMVVIPAGSFLMGSPLDEPKRTDNEGPQHEVCIARLFAMGVHAVTFDDYKRFVKATVVPHPDDKSWGRGSRPVINVSWQDANAYCNWLRAQSGYGYRLPSEAEWEYACRARTTTPFHFGLRLSVDQANFNGKYTYNKSARGKYRERTLPVGSFRSNDFGLYDMHGNVWEWCQDQWHGGYQGAPQEGSAWDAGGDHRLRVVRGGSWYDGPKSCRAASRDFNPRDFYSDFIGFRVCRGFPIEALAVASLAAESR